MIKDAITEAIKNIVGDVEFGVEIPQYEGQGEYSSNVAMQLFSDKQGETLLQGFSFKSPRELAEQLVQKLSSDKSLSEMVEKIEVAGSGFINFFLKKPYLIKEMQTVLSEKGRYGTSEVGKGKLAIVEYSSPNIAKPFTVGHFRSTVIGDALANLLEATGWRVMRDNHLGDWGTQFGKQIYAIKEWGNEEEIAKSKNPVKELVALYVKFHEEADKDPSLVDKGREWFKRLEEGDDEARRIWKLCIDWSFKEFDRIYKMLNVTFHNEFENGRGLGESFFEDKMQVVIEELEKKDLLKEGEGGAKLVFFPDEKYPPAMILKSNGTTLYHTRDLATDLYRKRCFDPDLIVNEVGAEQTLYFKQLYEIESLMGWYEEGERVHVAHGLIRFKDGKMSTRKGNVIWLEDIIENAREKAFLLAKQDHSFDGSDVVSTKRDKHSDSAGKHILGFAEHSNLADDVGIGALKWNDLKREPKTEITFDWDEILAMQGNSGPYIQYTYARCQSVLGKAHGSKQSVDGLTVDDVQTEKLMPNNEDSKSESENRHSEFISESGLEEILRQAQDDKLELNGEELALLRSYPNYSDVIQNASKSYSPNLLCNYLYDLAQKYNTFYARHKILSDGEHTRSVTERDARHKILSDGEQTRNEIEVNKVDRVNPVNQNENSINSVDQLTQLTEFRLALTAATAIILKNGLTILGIKTPEQM